MVALSYAPTFCNCRKYSSTITKQPFTVSSLVASGLYLYTPDTHMICGLNELELVQDKFDNVIDAAQDMEVNEPLLK